MKQKSFGGAVMIGTVMTALFVCGARAQYAEGSAAPAASPAPALQHGGPASTNAITAAPDDGQTGRKPGLKAKHSPGVDDILRMMQAGVSTEVIRTYIENSPTHYSLNPDEIIGLKKQGVPDELTTAMVKRGAALTAQPNRPGKPSSLVLPYAGGSRSYGGLDPESYDYFQYYYLCPRTLAAANQRLFTPYPSMQGYWPCAYGLYGPMPFSPLPPSAFGRP
jgi:hypothetical protein